LKHELLKLNRGLGSGDGVVRSVFKTLVNKVLLTHGGTFTGNAWIPYMKSIETPGAMDDANLKTLCACLALSIIVTGAPPEPWAAWWVVSIIGGRKALLRMHPMFFESYISKEQLFALQSWVNLLESDEALTVPSAHYWSTPGLRQFLLETDTQVRVKTRSSVTAYRGLCRLLKCRNRTYGHERF
jgi:hypothetical protein